MVNSPIVSVLIPFKNAEAYIEESLDSMTQQSFKDVEIILINDSSSDSSESICREYASRDKRIRLENSNGNGIVDALNYGIQLSRGKYIARMDADDLSHPDRIRLQFEFMENNPDICVLGTGMETFIWDVKEKKKTSTINVQFPTDHEKIESYMKNIGTFWVLSHPTIFMRKSSLLSVGGYRKFYSRAEDLDLWVRFILEGHKLANLPHCLLEYRITDNNVTSVNRVERYLSTAVLINKVRSKKNTDELSHLPITLENFMAHSSSSSFIRMLTDFFVLLKACDRASRQNIYRKLGSIYSSEIIQSYDAIRQAFFDEKSWPKSFCSVLKKETEQDFDEFMNSLLKKPTGK